MKTITLKTTGKSLKDLLEEYGTGDGGFYPQEWYKDEKFFTEKSKPGEYEVYFDTDTRGKTFKEQSEMIPEGYEVAHPAIVAETILKHYKKTGERICEKWCVPTSSLDSDGRRVAVGSMDADGLYVYHYWDVNTYDNLGVSSSRKLPLKAGDIGASEFLTLEAAIERVKAEGYMVYKKM